MRTKKISIAVIFGLGLVATLPLAASAQAARSPRYYDYYDRAPAYHVDAMPACPKMCARDFSPCDPIYFKTADGRCAGIGPR